jgi:ubiquinone/menaquinone biosynthesis C-methylase UbiE
VNSREQFGPRAGEYATSTVHATGADRSVALLDLSPEAIALDIGTGAGHTAHALARRARYVLASDITPEMLSQTGRLARGRGLTNVQPIFSLAESLPYRDGSLDAATCRLAAHHFRDVAAFCREVARVLKRGGRALLIDVVVPEDEAAAGYINDIELHRDHSHVEDYTASRWRKLAEDAGLGIIQSLVSNEELAEEELGEWTRRSGTKDHDIEYIRGRFGAAPAGVVEAMSLRRAGSSFRWLWPVITIVAEKPA